jgi:hypothetical protein
MCVLSGAHAHDDGRRLVLNASAKPYAISMHQYVPKKEGEEGYEVNAVENCPDGAVVESAVQY